MGTSASGGGARGGNPLIPGWIDGGGSSNQSYPAIPLPAENPNSQQSNDNNAGVNDLNNNVAAGPGIVAPLDSLNRYRSPRTQFNKYVRSGGTNSGALKSALRNYSRNSAGGTRGMAKRMSPSTSRVAAFYNAINTIKEKGKGVALAQFNLSSYQNKPLFEILSSLSDEIFKDTGKVYEDTQDDSIVKQA